MSERMKFVARLMEGERMTDLCAEFGIARKTGHKVWNRYQLEGLDGLWDRTRRPIRSPSRTPGAVADQIVRMRRRYPSWGPKKLKERLEEVQPGVRWPAPSTIGVILKEAGMVGQTKRRRRATPSPTPLGQSSRPNQIWSIDFKGQFRLGNRRYCYPLTVSDHYSRFLLGCEALENTCRAPVQSTLRGIFTDYGLPATMRSDNGAPFASVGLWGLSQLSVWLMRLGIKLERIEPGHPEQNGRHERLHLTLKQEAIRPAADNLLQQQEHFDSFRQQYNEERPHESLDMKVPAAVYHRSERELPAQLPPLEYPLHDYALEVYSDGSAYFPPLKRRVVIGKALVGQRVGLREIETGTWLLTFMELDLGYLDEQSARVISTPKTTLPER